MTKPLKIAIR